MPGEEGLVAAGLAAAACINLDLQKVGGGGGSRRWRREGRGRGLWAALARQRAEGKEGRKPNGREGRKEERERKGQEDSKGT